MATIELREWAFNKAIEELAKINKRAEKLDLPSVSFAVISRYTKPEPKLPKDHLFYIPTDTVDRPYVELEYSVEPVKIAGYTPIATLTWDHSEAIAYVWPGQELPLEESQSAECDHCKKIRNRNRTFVLQADNGEYVRVGSACVKDYIGHSPERILAQVKFLSDLDAILTSTGGAGGRREKKVFELEFVLTNVAAAIRNYGWLGVAKAEEYGRDATAHIVYEWLYEREPRDGYLKPKVTVTAVDVSVAVAAIEWAKVQIPNNNYIANIGTIAKDGYGTFKEFNMAVSMVAAHFRAIEKEEDRIAREKAKEDRDDARLRSEYVGTVGEKVILSARLVLAKVVDSLYGATTLTKWETESGDIITWFASSNPEVEVGELYGIVGKVKDHRTYLDSKETLLTRCKIERIAV